MAKSQWSFKTAVELSAALAAKKVSAVELAEDAIARIERHDAKINAICVRDFERGLAAARIADAELARGVKKPLLGLPVTVKESYNVAGLPTTWGNPAQKDFRPTEDALPISRIKDAGGIILGKTNVPILSHTGTHADDSWAGPTLNVVMPDRVPGGSSAGTATAVGASMAVLGLAEETGGSIQNPASAQDLVGIKPTIGLVPNAGVMPLSGNRDVVGPIARTVKDAALCLDVLAGYSAEDPKTLAGVGKKPVGGYTSKFGLVAMDRATGVRTPKTSYGWFKGVATTGMLPSA